MLRKYIYNEKMPDSVYETDLCIDVRQNFLKCRISLIFIIIHHILYISYHILSHFITFYRILSHFITFYRILNPYFITFYHILSYFITF